MYYNFFNLPLVKFKRPTPETLNAFSAKLIDTFKYKDKISANQSDLCLAYLTSNEKTKLRELELKYGRFRVTQHALYILTNYVMSDDIWDHVEEIETLCELIPSIDKNDKTFKKISVDYKNRKIYVNTVYGDFPIHQFSQIEGLTEEDKKYLGSKARYQNCHKDAIRFMKKLGGNSKIATAYISTTGYVGKYLHSWIELNIEGEPFVIDTTRNILMDRRTFFIVNQLHSRVYKIPKSTFLKEEEMFIDMCKRNGWLSKLYLTNRHQAIEAYKIYMQEDLKCQEVRQKALEEDPLYQAAKHFHDSLVDNFEKNYPKASKTVAEKE